MKEKIKVCDGFIKWLDEVLEDMIINTMNDEPDKVPTLLLVNELLAKLDIGSNTDIDKYVGEKLTNKIFDEIKKSI